MEMQALRADLWTWDGGSRGWDEWREQHGSTHRAICQTDRQPGAVCCLTQELRLGLCDDLAGWDGAGGGGRGGIYTYD